MRSYCQGGWRAEDHEINLAGVRSDQDRENGQRRNPPLLAAMDHLPVPEFRSISRTVWTRWEGAWLVWWGAVANTPHTTNSSLGPPYACCESQNQESGGGVFLGGVFLGGIQFDGERHQVHQSLAQLFTGKPASISPDSNYSADQAHYPPGSLWLATPPTNGFCEKTISAHETGKTTATW